VRFGVQRRTLLAAIERGALAAEKVGKMWVVRPSAVQRWIDRGKHTPGPPKKRKVGRPAPERGQQEGGGG
jgi:excisionase family DNA binding protein